MDPVNPYQPPGMEGPPARFPVSVMILRNSAIVLCSIGLVICFISHGQQIGGILILSSVFIMCMATIIGQAMGFKPRRGRVRAGWAAAILLVLFGSSMIASGSISDSLNRKRIAELEATKSEFEAMSADSWVLQ